MVEAPAGYKIVVHRPCGTAHSFVKESVNNGDRMRASDVKLLDGTIPDPVTAVPPCTQCGPVTSNSLKIL